MAPIKQVLHLLVVTSSRLTKALHITLSSPRGDISLNGPVSLSHNTDHLMLHQGSIQCLIEKQHLNPFILKTEHVDIQVTGTIYNAEILPHRTEVSLSEGSIKLTSRHLRTTLDLAPSQTVSISDDGIFRFPVGETSLGTILLNRESYDQYFNRGFHLGSDSFTDGPEIIKINLDKIDNIDAYSNNPKANNNDDLLTFDNGKLVIKTPRNDPARLWWNIPQLPTAFTIHMDGIPRSGSLIGLTSGEPLLLAKSLTSIDSIGRAEAPQIKAVKMSDVVRPQELFSSRQEFIQIGHTDQEKPVYETRVLVNGIMLTITGSLALIDSIGVMAIRSSELHSLRITQGTFAP